MTTLNLYNLRWDVEDIKKHKEEIQRLKVQMQNNADRFRVPDFEIMLSEMKACERYINEDGVMCFSYLGHEMLDEDYRSGVAKKELFLNDIDLNESDNIFEVVEDNGFYYLSGMPTTDNIMEYYTNPLPVKSRTIKADENKVIEVCQNGLICTGFIEGKKIYYSEDRLVDLMSGVPRQVYDSLVGYIPKYKYTVSKDGVAENMLNENHLVGRKSQVKLSIASSSAQLSRYSGYNQLSVRLTELGKSEAGILFNAHLERAKHIGSDERDYLYNPALSHVYQTEALEKYIRGEITEEGLYISTLMDVAENPALILMYGLLNECKKYGISVAEFRIDNNRIVNKYGVGYRELADLYCRGSLPKRYVRNQKDIQNLDDVKNDIFGVNKAPECVLV
jgi:hypothetical protein